MTLDLLRLVQPLFLSRFSCCFACGITFALVASRKTTVSAPIASRCRRGVVFKASISWPLAEHRRRNRDISARSSIYQTPKRNIPDNIADPGSSTAHRWLQSNTSSSSGPSRSPVPHSDICLAIRRANHAPPAPASPASPPPSSSPSKATRSPSSARTSPATAASSTRRHGMPSHSSSAGLRRATLTVCRAGAHWRTSATSSEPMLCDWDVQTFDWWTQQLEREARDPTAPRSGLKARSLTPSPLPAPTF